MMLRHLAAALILSAILALAAVPAPAKSSFLNELKKKYPEPKLSKALTCAICHPGGDRSKLTLFGQDFKKQSGTTAEKLAKLEKLDSDKDKYSNLEEIKAGSDPSDPKSTPKTVASPAKADDKKSTAAKAVKAGERITTGTRAVSAKVAASGTSKK